MKLEQKLKNQIAWLESLEHNTEFNRDVDSIKLRIVENRKYFQHERLIHLVVTMTTAIILMFAFYLFISQANRLYGVLLLILLVLEGAYLVHYYRLENGVQKLWEIEQRLFEKKD